MIIRMKKGSNGENIKVATKMIESLGCRAGISQGVEEVIISVIGNTAEIDKDQLESLPGVAEIVPVSSQYKQAAQIGVPGNFFYSTVKIGNVVIGGEELVIIGGPCSLENKTQISKAATIVKEAGAQGLRGGVKKWRTDPSDWHGVGGSTQDELRRGLDLIVGAADHHGLASVVEIISVNDIEIYLAAGVSCFQIGETNAKNQDLLDALAQINRPILYKRARDFDIDEYLMRAKRLMQRGNTNIILCERGGYGPTSKRFLRNQPDIGGIADLRYGETHLPIAFDPSHSMGKKDLVTPAALASIPAGASCLIVETHPNPQVAITDGKQSLYPEQFRKLCIYAKEQWALTREHEKGFIYEESLYAHYRSRIEHDRKRFHAGVPGIK